MTEDRLRPVASFVNDKYGDVTVESIPQGTAFCYSFSVGKRTFAQMPFTLRCVQYIVTQCFIRPAIHVCWACGSYGLEGRREPNSSRHVPDETAERPHSSWLKNVANDLTSFDTWLRGTRHAVQKQSVCRLLTSHSDMGGLRTQADAC